MDDEEEEVCAICKTRFELDQQQEWTTEDGETVVYESSSVKTVIADTSLGEMRICEPCIRQGLPEYFTEQDRSEVHYQIALEYSCFSEDWRTALEYLSKTLETPKSLAAMGNCHSRSGDKTKAAECYRRALKIDPTHFIASENLKNLLERSESEENQKTDQK